MELSLGTSGGLELGDAGGHLSGNGTGELELVGSESSGTELEDPMEVWIAGGDDVCTRRVHLGMRKGRSRMKRPSVEQGG
jgi:hypothetical protein